MKTLFVLILCFVTINCFSQSGKKSGASEKVRVDTARLATANTAPLRFTAGESISSKSMVIYFDLLNAAYIKEADKAAKYAHQTDSIKWAIVRNILTVSQIDFTRISQNGDSLKVTSEGVFLKLRKQ